MLRTVEIDRDECESLLRARVVGRVALSTPNGPRIFAATYIVVDGDIVVRASPFSVLGTYGRDSLLAFETGDSEDLPNAWSVVVQGRGSAVVDRHELERIRDVWPSNTWVGEARHLFMRLPWKAISGRRTDSRAVYS